MKGMKHISRALISVSDKVGLDHLGECLAEHNVEIFSTGGTAKFLRDRRIDVVDVSSYTGWKEMMEGRVKTLHPMVHGAILFDRDKVVHVQDMKAHNMRPIDLVVVNLYPFQETIANPDVTADQAIEEIDIGGPAMIRSAAKNFKHVAVVTDPLRYSIVIREMESSGGCIGLETRLDLAREAFCHTCDYDKTIADFMLDRIAANPDATLRLREEADPINF
jgi:phosphoribosylaminoimidazolecarboxamide formyltransferase/IMP cyclohydrolase